MFRRRNPDEEFRRIERRGQSDDQDAQIRDFNYRIRIGQLPVTVARLVAGLGFPPAQAALGISPIPSALLAVIGEWQLRFAVLGENANSAREIFNEILVKVSAIQAIRRMAAPALDDSFPYRRDALQCDSAIQGFLNHIKQEKFLFLNLSEIGEPSFSSKAELEALHLRQTILRAKDRAHLHQYNAEMAYFSNALTMCGLFSDPTLGALFFQSDVPSFWEQFRWAVQRSGHPEERLKQLEKFWITAILENYKVPVNWPKKNPLTDKEFYHGSPYSSGTISDFSNFELAGNLLFLTPCRQVANDYTTPLLAAGRKPTQRQVEDKPVIYTVRIGIPDDLIFDTRNPAHEAVFNEIVDELATANPRHERFRDLIHTPWLPGCNVNTAGLLPSFGSVRVLVKPLKDKGFRGVWISESSQGASLALFYPEDAKILHTEFLRRNPDDELRRLERTAAQGDPQGRHALRLARLRAGQPMFQHNCDRCIFLGSEKLIDLDNYVSEHPPVEILYDYYFCPAGGASTRVDVGQHPENFDQATLVWRRGDESGEYSSFTIGNVLALLSARQMTNATPSLQDHVYITMLQWAFRRDLLTEGQVRTCRNIAGSKNRFGPR